MKSREDFTSPSWFLTLRAIYDSLKSTERKVADFILGNTVKIRNMTITETARAIGCSEATLFRLSKKLGFDGYPQLREACRRAESEGNRHMYPDIDPEDSSEQLLHKVFSTTILTLKNTLNMINLHDYESAVDQIMRAKKLSFFAIGGASSVATIGFYKFNRIGWPCTFFSDPDLSLIAASQLEKGDAAIAISHSGRSRPVIEAAKLGKKSQAVVIGITNFPLSPLAKISDVVLLTSAFAEYSSGDIFANRVAQLCIVESLYVGVVHSLHPDRPELMSGITRINEAININKL